MSSSHSVASDALSVERARLPAMPLNGVPVIVAVADALAVITAAAIADVAFGGGVLSGQQVFGGNAFVIVAAAALVATLLFGQHASVYSSRALLTGKVKIAWPVTVFATGVAFFACVSLAAGASLTSASLIAAFLVGGCVLIASSRAVVRSYVRHAVRTRSIRGPSALLISCSTPGVDQIVEELDLSGYTVERQLDLSRTAGQDEIERVVENAMNALRGSDIEEVLVAVDCMSMRLARPIMNRLAESPLPVRLVLNPMTTELFASKPQQVGDLSTFEIKRPPRTVPEQIAKRFSDVVIAGSALVLLAPLFAVIAIAIKLDSPGPVFFRQRRNGFNGRSFRIFKFRSMRVMEDGEVVTQAKRNDSRVTRVGGFLRRTSLDEIPQLLNVLAGDMSVVGPRPHAISHDDYYSKSLAEYCYRQHALPGITGWAQINGFRGETSTIDSMRARVEHDRWYIEHWSFWLDIWIVIKTALEVVRSRNAY